MNENEKVYKTMNSTGIICIISGIVLMVIAVAAGVLSVISGARLLKNKKNITF